MKKILFLMGCSILVINSNQAFACNASEDQDYQAALNLSMEVNGIGEQDFDELLTSTSALFSKNKDIESVETRYYSQEDLELIVAMADSEEDERIRQIAFSDSGEKEEKNVKKATDEKPDEYYAFSAGQIVQKIQKDYEGRLKEKCDHLKSIYSDENEIRSITAIIQYLEHDSENTPENRDLLNLLRAELEDKGQELYKINKPNKQDMCQKIATELKITFEQATRVYETTFE